ncbi:MAG: phosphoglycerate dehydrogenase [Rhizobiales bacterium]|nr:phosphoglycerate dehydrogenase [Hyphomicrobiales bacterium]
MNLDMKAARQKSLDATANGAPTRPTNQFFGVGPITDMTTDEMASRMLKIEFYAWLEATYPKLDDNGAVIGNYTTAELGRGMHRGYPADKVLLDMMGEMTRYFEFPKKNKIAIGLGGGHSGFSVAAMHLLSANKPDQKVFVDTPKPESDAAKKSGFFRQSWGAQLTEMLIHAKNGDPDRLHFAGEEGNIPSAKTLKEMGIKLFFGVGHETTGATTYTEDEIKNLLAWIDLDPINHHAVIDSTSLLGAMPWADAVIAEMFNKCCMFTPFQKAIGGVSGYFIFAMTPQAMDMIDDNMKQPSWAIPRQLKIACPTDMKMPLTSELKTSLGPIYDPATKSMLGGIINTFSTLAFAETTFAILRNERNIGDVKTLNKRAMANREFVTNWVENNPLFELGVKHAPSRGTAVSLLKVVDSDITDPAMHQRIIAESKKLLGFDGLTHPNGSHEKGLDVARYVNAFPGTDGDYRAWIGGIRPANDIPSLLENLEYAYHRAKILVLEQELAKDGVTFEAEPIASNNARLDDATRAYKILIADLVGMKFDANGKPDHNEVKTHIESKGGIFHEASAAESTGLKAGMHFFYLPNLSTSDELMVASGEGQYDAVIAAATFFPADTKFEFGGVRIGAGTGNMGSNSWGGGDGAGGAAPLMNTPSFNSRTTAQTAIKALLKVMPNLAVQEMHDRVCAKDFDTGKNLCEYPTTKIESKKIAIIGYGNIGREVAKLAKAFGMEVVIFARPNHKDWIMSEGFSYASSILEACTGADVVSPHLGLGAFDEATKTFANAGIIDDKILSAMRHGAVVVNYDRGELVCTKALDSALTSGQISYAAIDADLFKDTKTGALSGPMVPYLDIYPNHIGKMELLPHAAADTEHYSRVDGAKQAVDQIFDVIQYKKVVNLKGDLPDGYTDGKALTVNGVGKVTPKDISKLSADELKNIRALTEQLAAFWGSIEATKDLDRRADLIKNHASDATKNANKLTAFLANNGLNGPFSN